MLTIVAITVIAIRIADAFRILRITTTAFATITASATTTASAASGC